MPEVDSASLRRSLLEPFLQPAPREVKPDSPEHDDYRDAGSREEAVARDGIRGGLSAVERDEPDSDRPHDPARRVPEEEAPPRHASEPGNPRSGEPQDRDEATEEHRLGPVTLHDPLRSRNHALRPALQPAIATEERPPAPTA